MSVWPFLLLQVVIFVALVVVLRRILSRNLTSATVHLQGLSVEYGRRQEELKKRLEEAEQQYREQMSRAKSEAEQMVTRARQEAESSRVRLLEEARTESERIVQQGLESREAMRKEIEQRMERRAIERACELIQQALPDRLRRDIHAQWLEQLIREGLAQLDQIAADDHLREAAVVSAFPLTADQRQALRGRLKGKVGHDIELVEAVDGRLVAGLTITMGSLVLDGSLSSKLQHAARQAQTSP
jgi:F-type H+-transporting ATPase subunit b